MLATLLQAGISTEGCATPLELFNRLGGDAYDAVVLELSELGEIGYALVSRLRTSSTLGIVVVGADLGLETRLRCLQSGADVCVPGAPDSRELAGVMLALARRLAASQPVVLDDPEPRDEPAARWELRDQSWTLMSPSGVAISLSANERLIVRALLDVAGRAVGRMELGKQLESDSSLSRASGSRSIDVIISRLRRKAELAGVTIPIRTVYGSGYLFTDH
ncbi:winged helix-turn-helix domain-containing protein [Bordetella petrii]|nr:winged helix-turn-helix domain-containing protein [Bordetella petrii]MCD0504694.1 winged helix-turn-helix domain-containing protein [Bordetella petrii]